MATQSIESKKKHGKSSKEMRKKTKTCSFGTTIRENHDSSKFYNLNLLHNFKVEKKIRKVVPNEIHNKYINTIFPKSSEMMIDIPDNSIHLMITSPPYNVGKEYDLDLSFLEYINFLKRVFMETYRVLIPGGRVCINIANLGRKPYIPLNGFISKLLLDIGYLLRGEIIWNKTAGAVGGNCAWGSWKSAKNPVLRDQHEYIIIASKDTFGRKEKDLITTIDKEQFLEYTRSIWTFSPESAKRIGHPAPFPIELPSRCIQLYSFENDIILDPFMGSGTTAIAALKTNRNFIGYEIDLNYIQLANKRLSSQL